MLATIVLPPGTVRVTLKDIPALFADAICPPLPQGTPRVLSYLEKQATSPELASQWCGQGNNFAISLTERDVRELNEGVWANLPSLVLLPSDGEGPQKLAHPLPEPEWEPYATAFGASPPTGWTLITVWRNTVMEQWFMNHDARKQWKRLLERQATSGQVLPRPAASGIPTQHAPGQHHGDAFLTVEEFIEFARQFSVDVRVQRRFIRTPLVAQLLHQFRNEPQGEIVTVQENIGSYEGEAWQTVGKWVLQFEEIAKRQAAGYFTVGEAAQMLADAYALSAKDLLKRIALAQVNGRRLVRGPDKMPLSDDSQVREYRDLVKVEELNDWLAAIPVEYRVELTPTEPLGFVPLEKRLAPYFAFPLAQLPAAIAALVRKEFDVFQWDEVTASQRRSLAQQKDSQSDPALEGMRTFYWNQAARRHELQREIEKVRGLPAPDVAQYARKREMLAELEEQLQQVEAESWTEAPRESRSGGQQSPTPTPTPDADADADADAVGVRAYSTKGMRRHVLAPIIDKARDHCRNPNDTAEVWIELCRRAGLLETPLLGVTEDGIKYEDGDEVKYLNRKALGQRVSRSPRRTA